MNESNFVVQEDMICPISGNHCDDECCVVGSTCNISSEEITQPFTFEQELTSLLNRYSKENDSNTPDWILARYLSNCLSNYNSAVIEREKFYGRDLDKSFYDLMF